MALTQMQQIQSLGEALAWLEREIGWGVKPATLTHLCGRIGELYACVLTNGQMALATNQHGYDVVTEAGERVSVKTTTQRLPVQVPFNGNTLSNVDRVIVLRINTDEMQVETLYDANVQTARALMSNRAGAKLFLTMRPSEQTGKSGTSPREVRSASHDSFKVIEFENGSIQVWSMGEQIEPAKPALRKLAASLGVDTRNSRGNEFNTRQLGTQVLNRLDELWGHLPSMPPPLSPSNLIG
jgi:hypothetical protein